MHNACSCAKGVDLHAICFVSCRELRWLAKGNWHRQREPAGVQQLVGLGRLSRLYSRSRTLVLATGLAGPGPVAAHFRLVSLPRFPFLLPM